MTQRQPNFVFILPDQMRPDFLSCYGADFLQTPHMDSIARNGIRYTNAVSSSPLCVPARTALLTGISALRNGVLGNEHAVRPDYTALGVRTWPQLLAERGYRTAAVGKMHFHPWDASHGFRERVIAEDKRHIEIDDDYQEFLKANGLRKTHGAEQPGYFEHKGAVLSAVPYEYTVDHFVGGAACEFLAKQTSAQPFALMVGFPSPHCPYDPDPRFLDQIDAQRIPDALPEATRNAPGLRRWNIERNRHSWNGMDYTDFPAEAKQRIRWHYAALVRQVDEEVGRILAALAKHGLADNTVVVLSSDHGDYLGDHNLIGKSSFYDAAIRVPLLVHVPHAPVTTVRDELVELHDITATMLHLAGCEPPPVMDSRPLPGVVDSAAGRSHVVGVLESGWMVYDGRWKLHRYATGDNLLFDLYNDPHEQRNRIADPGAGAELL